MSSTDIKTLVDKIAALLPQLEERGSVYFFALGERVELNRWEVVLSSHWSDQNYAASVYFVARALSKALEPNEMKELSSISIIPSSEPNIVEMPKDLEGISSREESIIDFTLMGLEIRRAYVFKAVRPASVNLTAAA